MGNLILQPEISRENNVSVYDTISFHYNNDYIRLAVYALSPAMEQEIKKGLAKVSTPGDDIVLNLPASAIIQMNNRQSLQLLVDLAGVIRVSNKIALVPDDTFNELIENTKDFLKYLEEMKDARKGKK